MMSAKLNHPKLGNARFAEDRKGVGRPRGGVGRAAVRQSLIGPHDVERLPVPPIAQQDAQQPQGGLALRLIHFAKTQARTRHIADGKVRPHRLAILLADENDIAVKAAFEVGRRRLCLRGEWELYRRPLLVVHEA